MTIHEAYRQFLDLINRNSTNDNSSASRPRFIRAFNKAQNSFVNWSIEKGNQKDRRLIQKLIVTGEKLSVKSISTMSSSFSLPSDYFEHLSLTAYASQGDCKKQPMLMTELKGENTNILLTDTNSKPSFKFREGLYQVGNNSVILYNDEQDLFTYSEVRLDYYRKPIQVDIEGYINSDNKESEDIDPEFEDRVVEKILLIAAKDFNVNSDYVEKYPVDKDRINTKV